jgi:RNA polymerase sigma-70 factor (ECF subfamily)
MRAQLSLDAATGAGDAPSEALARLARGEPAALGAAYDQHHARVRAFAQSLLGDAAAAEDLVQDVFVALPAVARRFRGESSFATFLCAIAVNHARHHVRSAVRRRRAMEHLAREPAPLHAADPERTAAHRELSDALVRALDALPIDQRVAFVLCDVEERSSAEAAAIAGAPEATVRTRLFHARKKLRALLAQEALR